MGTVTHQCGGTLLLRMSSSRVDVGDVQRQMALKIYDCFTRSNAWPVCDVKAYYMNLTEGHIVLYSFKWIVSYLLFSNSITKQIYYSNSSAFPQQGTS